MNHFQLQTFLPYMHGGSNREYVLSLSNTCRAHRSPTKFKPEAEFTYADMSGFRLCPPVSGSSVNLTIRKCYLRCAILIGLTGDRGCLWSDLNTSTTGILSGRSHRSLLVLDAGYVERRRYQIIQPSSWAKGLCAAPCF